MTLPSMRARVLGALLGGLVLWIPFALAQSPEEPKAEAKPTPAPGKESTPSPTPGPAPAPAVVHRRITLGGKPIAYTATAATIDLKDSKNEPVARMFYVSYT